MKRNPYTKKLKLAKDMNFIEAGQRFSSSLISRPAGESVSVTWQPGIQYGTAYVQNWDGRMFSSCFSANDVAGKFKNWPKDWTLDLDAA